MIRKRRPSQEPFEIDIERLDHEGRGIGYFDHRTVFVDGALPGEHVRAKYLQKRTKTADAATLEVLSSASDRVVGPCDFSDYCGGCALQHMHPSEQLKNKQRAVLELLKAKNVVPGMLADAIESTGVGYRRKARLGVRYVAKKEKVLIGFREKHHHFLADIDSCKTLIPEVGESLDALSQCILSMEARCHIPQIEVSAGDDDVALTVRHLKPLSADDQAALSGLGESLGVRIYLQPKGPGSVHCLYPSSEVPLLYYRLPAFDLTLFFQPSDFIQVNKHVNQKMVQQAIDWLEIEESDRVLDLFSGLGNFSLPLARQALHVTGVEGSEEMVVRARQNAQRNGIENTAFYVADLSQDCRSLPWFSAEYDKVLLDPSRAGAQAMVECMHAFFVKQIVYVSCNPATFARDASLLEKQGYRLEKLSVIDMFPHTAHVETMGLFVKEAAHG